MTKLLQQVISEIQKLPAEQQDAIALRLMAELKDEQRWTEQFESTTDEQWDRLAALVRQEIASGDISPLDEVFPIKPCDKDAKDTSRRAT
jgi:hypothetical protein